jgi:hypothetical protein
VNLTTSVLDGGIYHPATFCANPDCDMQTVGILHSYHGPGKETTRYECDRCGKTEIIDGTQVMIENNVAREIQRLVRTGDWAQSLRRKPWPGDGAFALSWFVG